jgi:hypothetical protein
MPTRGYESCTSPISEEPRVVEQGSPPASSPNLDIDADDAPLKLRALDDILGPMESPGFADRQLTEELLAAICDEPTLVEEALKSKRLRVAMSEELSSIRENGTWSVVDLPRGQHAIGLKWVFKIKHDEHGKVTKHKARLVAKGYV